MRILRALTRLQMGLALALLGIALALLPLGLSAVGYELTPKEGYGILVLAALFVVGAVIVFFWPWIKEAWSWIRRDAELQRLITERRGAIEARDRWRKHFEEKQSEAQRLDAVRGRQLEKIREVERERDELRQENEELIAEPENRPDLPDTLEEWLNTVPLKTIANRTYRNERIELDGFLYDRCVFEDCTFSFKGTKPFRVVESSEVKGTVNIDARGPQLQALLIFMKQLGALHPNSKWYDFYDGRFID